MRKALEGLVGGSLYIASLYCGMTTLLPVDTGTSLKSVTFPNWYHEHSAGEESIPFTRTHRKLNGVEATLEDDQLVVRSDGKETHIDSVRCFYGIVNEDVLYHSEGKDVIYDTHSDTESVLPGNILWTNGDRVVVRDTGGEYLLMDSNTLSTKRILDVDTSSAHSMQQHLALGFIPFLYLGLYSLDISRRRREQFEGIEKNDESLDPIARSPLEWIADQIIDYPVRNTLLFGTPLVAPLPLFVLMGPQTYSVPHTIAALAYGTILLGALHTIFDSFAQVRSPRGSNMSRNSLYRPQPELHLHKDSRYYTSKSWQAMEQGDFSLAANYARRANEYSTSSRERNAPGAWLLESMTHARHTLEYLFNQLGAPLPSTSVESALMSDFMAAYSVGRYDEALSIAEGLVHSEAQSSVYLFNGLLQKEHGDVNKSKKYIEQAIQMAIRSGTLAQHPESRRKVQISFDGLWNTEGAVIGYDTLEEAHRSITQGNQYRDFLTTSQIQFPVVHEQVVDVDGVPHTLETMLRGEDFASVLTDTTLDETKSLFRAVSEVYRKTVPSSRVDIEARTRKATERLGIDAAVADEVRELAALVSSPYVRRLDLHPGNVKKIGRGYGLCDRETYETATPLSMEIGTYIAMLAHYLGPQRAKLVLESGEQIAEAFKDHMCVEDLAFEILPATVLRSMHIADSYSRRAIPYAARVPAFAQTALDALSLMQLEYPMLDEALHDLAEQSWKQKNQQPAQLVS